MFFVGRMVVEMENLALRLVGVDALDSRTSMARLQHHVMGSWAGHTQVWKWAGGDAIVVVCGYLGREVRTWAAVRQGDEVKCVDITNGGIAGYLRAFGYATTVEA